MHNGDPFGISFFFLSFFLAACRSSEAPTNYATSSARWQKTQNGLGGGGGTLECTDGDYLYMGDNPALTCTGLGQWRAKDGQCKQRIWRNRVAGFN